MAYGKPIDTDVRICFAIAWYATEKEAKAAGAMAHENGDYYNGGWFHGMACGRDKNWDRRDERGNVIAFAATY